MHIAEVVTIAKSLPLLRLNTYKSLILSYSADYRRILRKKYAGNKIAEEFSSLQMIEDELYGKYKEFYGYVFFIAKKVD